MSSQVAGRAGQIKAVVRVSCGNFLEMYDFMVYGYYATAIARAFFPTGNEFSSLMLSLATFVRWALSFWARTWTGRDGKKA